MYYNRLAQTRRVGQHVSADKVEVRQTDSESTSDLFEFGSERPVEETVKLEICKGLSYPLD